MFKQAVQFSLQMFVEEIKNIIYGKKRIVRQVDEYTAKLLTNSNEHVLLHVSNWK